MPSHKELITQALEAYKTGSVVRYASRAYMKDTEGKWVAFTDEDAKGYRRLSSKHLADVSVEHGGYGKELFEIFRKE